MKKKRRIWIFAVAVAMTAVQGTVFAEAQETGSPVEAVKETISETTESEQILDTKALMEDVYKRQRCMHPEVPILRGSVQEGSVQTQAVLT